MTYTQMQRAKQANALARSRQLALEAANTSDAATQRELQEAARDWTRHADRIANKLHARRKLQGAR